MEFDEQIYKAFLEEMNRLENFRMMYAAAHPSTPLDSDDPDVKRLIEAMAFFSARTHLSGIRNIQSTRSRIFRQFFPYLLAPLPAMGILHVQPTGQFVESVFIPKDSEIAVSSETEGLAIFRTMGDLDILPISITGMTMVDLPNKGHRVFLRIRAPFPLNVKIGQLRFHINHLNDYHASMRVFYCLRKYLNKVTVVFDEKPSDRSRGALCSLSFGLPSDESDDMIQHPLQRERLFFHFPQQELFLGVKIPSPPRDWEQFTLVLDLDPKWPKNLRLNREIFQLFSIPIINLQRSTAQPFIYDGTRERHPIRHMEPDKGFEFHSTIGVFRNEKESMVPVKAGILSGEQGSYEIEQNIGRNGRQQSWVNLHFPRAFEEPKTFIVEALWHQPWLADILGQKLDVSLYNKSITGLNWSLVSELIPHSENVLQDEMEGFMHLLALRNQPILGIDDVASILRILGSVRQGKFKGVVELLKDIRVEETPLQKGSGPGMLKHTYFFKFRGINQAAIPLIETFCIHVGRILDAWISEVTVKVKIEISQ